jgi:hypothetical protein
MDANGLVVMPGKGPAWKMAPGRSSTLKLRNGETDESVMIFEEVAPVGTVTPMHLHHDSDEVAYVLSGEITQDRRRSHSRRARHLRLHAARCSACLEEHRRRDRPRAVHVHPRKGRKAVRGDGGTAGRPNEPAGVRRGCRKAWLGDRRPAAVLSRRNPRTGEYRCPPRAWVSTCAGTTNSST